MQSPKPLFVLKNRIHEIRNARGLTVEALSAKSGISPAYISQMARGDRNVSLKNLEKLAQALECRPEDLLIGNVITSNHDILNLWASIPAERRDLARQVLESFTANGPVDNQPPTSNSKPSVKTIKHKPRDT